MGYHSQSNMKVRLVRRKVPINCSVTYYKEVLKEAKQQILVCIDWVWGRHNFASLQMMFLKLHSIFGVPYTCGWKCWDFYIHCICLSSWLSMVFSLWGSLHIRKKSGLLMSNVLRISYPPDSKSLHFRVFSVSCVRYIMSSQADKETSHLPYSLMKL